LAGGAIGGPVVTVDLAADAVAIRLLSLSKFDWLGTPEEKRMGGLYETIVTAG
jgi:hypothetical protein